MEAASLREKSTHAICFHVGRNGTCPTAPGKWREEYLALYESEGLAVQRRILGRLMGCYGCEIGELNQIVHLWAYTDLLERDQRRAELPADE